MRRDIFRKILEDRLGFDDFLAEKPLPRTGYRDGLASGRNRHESGTTILAFHYSDGLLFAGDRQTSCGFSIVDQDKIKIYPLASHVACAAAGLVSDIQMCVRMLASINSTFLTDYGKPLSIEGQVNYLVGICRKYYRYYGSLEMGMILGGLDLTRRFQLFEVGEDGFKRRAEYLVMGSGQDYAVSKLDENGRNIKERKLNENDAIDLAVRAINASGKRDLGSSDIRLAYPTIMTITKEGITFVEDSIVKKAVKKVVDGEGGHHVR